MSGERTFERERRKRSQGEKIDRQLAKVDFRRPKIRGEANGKNSTPSAAVCPLGLRIGSPSAVVLAS